MKDMLYQPTIHQFEIVRRTLHEPGPKIHRPSDTATHFGHMEAFDREHIIRLDLNNAHETIGFETVCIGTDNQALVGPKEVFRGALLSGASCIILIHNHPSGRVCPSEQDCQVASNIRDLGIKLDMPMLDFMIIGRRGEYYSFSEHDLP